MTVSKDAVFRIKSEISYRISTLRNLLFAAEGMYIGAGGSFIISAGATHCQLTSAWPWTWPLIWIYAVAIALGAPISIFARYRNCIRTLRALERLLVEGSKSGYSPRFIATINKLNYARGARDLVVALKLMEDSTNNHAEKDALRARQV